MCAWLPRMGSGLRRNDESTGHVRVAATMSGERLGFLASD